jgi:CRISPR-associated protein Cmr2
VALPRRLARKGADRRVLKDARRMLGLLEAAQDAEEEGEYERAQTVVRQTLGRGRDEGTEPRLETYYALLLLDGDHMGAWLSGGDEHAITYRDSFHPQVQRGFDALAAGHDALRRYGAQPRALSPNRHLAISGALNDFALNVVRHMVEEEHLGRLIYAGGDDVLAMLPVADLLPAMARLREAYSGVGETCGARGVRLSLDNGFALLEKESPRSGRQPVRLMRMMGARATASCGAVIAHHQAPLGAVLRELRAAEQRAKGYARPGGDGRPKDRDALSLTVIKRSGGALRLSADWGEPVALLSDLRRFLADPGLSRRAVYQSLEWLTDLPEPAGDGAMLEALLGYQLARQAKEVARNQHDTPGLARWRPKPARRAAPTGSVYWLEDLEAGADGLRRLAEVGLWGEPCEDPVRRAEGFNRVAVAAWT